MKTPNVKQKPSNITNDLDGKRHWVEPPLIQACREGEWQAVILLAGKFPIGIILEAGLQRKKEFASMMDIFH